MPVQCIAGVLGCDTHDPGLPLVESVLMYYTWRVSNGRARVEEGGL